MQQWKSCKLPWIVPWLNTYTYSSWWPVQWAADWITEFCLKALPIDSFLLWKQKTFRKQKRIEILNMLLVNDWTLISKWWVAKPPHKFCKQKISDSPESRIILTNVSMLPLKCLMPFSSWCDLERVTRSCWKNKTKQNKTKQKNKEIDKTCWNP